MSKLIAAFTIVVLASTIATSQTKDDTYTLIKNVVVWDASGPDTRNADVLIENNMIKEVGAGLSAPEGATVIDGEGGLLTPGLIDMHTHIMLGGPGGYYAGQSDYDAFAIGAFAYRDMNILLQSGFTSIRDIAGNSLSLAKAVKEKAATGPRIWSSGPAFSSTGGHGDSGPWNQGLDEVNAAHITMNLPQADGVDEVIKQARWNFRHGAAFLKIFVGGGVASDYDPLEIIEYTEEELKAIVRICDDNKTYATIHAYRDDAINRALDAGVKCIEHGFMMSEETVKRLARDSIVLSLQGYMSVIGFGNPEAVPWFTPEQVRKAKQVNEAAKKMIKMAREQNVFIVTGSDMFAENTSSAKKNITIEVDLGWEPWEVLQHSTINAGKVLAMSGPARSPYRDGPIGVIKEGAYADMIIWENSPLEDIENVLPNENLKVIIQDGAVVKNTLGN